jgi:hypothetical protein
MADDPIPPNVDAMISRDAGLPTEKQVVEEAGPIYKMMEGSKIPVSKSEASLWKSRRDAGKQAISNVAANWKQAAEYYSLGQENHREDAGGTRKGNSKYARNPNRRYNSTENIVYSNVNSVVPSILAKNPEAEITSFLKEMEPIALILKHLVNRLGEIKYAPGFNIKPKLRKCIVRTEIANEAWIMVGYTKKEDSAQQAQTDLAALGAQLVEAKNQTEILEIEGKLIALEETVDILNPAGPFLRTFIGEQVLVDPTSQEDDFSDANWMMVEIMLPTKYILAKFAIKDGEQYTAIYNEQYIISAGSMGDSDAESELNNFKILKNTDTFDRMGYSSEEAMKKAQMTKCWYAFDKVKRRFLLIANDYWKWPLWVYDDPYQLPGFFPLFRLQYHTDPLQNRTKGEVSFYLDQQDEINDINSEINRMRTQIIGKMLYDSRYIDKDQFDAYMKGGDQLAFGVGKSIPEGMKIQDIIMAPPLPNLQYKELFDKKPIYDTIDRISSVNAITRGAEFKTNTTNDAIGVYNSIQNQKLDEKIDAIEDFSGDIFYAVMFLCAQFMTQDEVKFVLGEESAQWQQQEASVIKQQFMCRCLGGSTQKPTSANKKDQAMKMGQILGQFASASPAVVIVMLKAMQKAFDDFTISSDDWDMIIESVTAKLQQGQAPIPGAQDVPQGQPQPNPIAPNQPPPQVPIEGAEAQPQEQQRPEVRPPANHAEEVQLQHAIAGLPPQAQKAIKAAVGKGVPEAQAYAEVAAILKKQGPSQNTQAKPATQQPVQQH